MQVLDPPVAQAVEALVTAAHRAQARLWVEGRRAGKEWPEAPALAMALARIDEVMPED